MADFTIRDNNTKIRITCLKRDGSFYNLTGHTVKMRFRIRNVDHEPVTMTIIDAVGGVAEFNMRTDPGVTLTDMVNNRLDIAYPSGGAITSLIIPPGLYTRMDDIVDAVELQLLGLSNKFSARYDPLTGLVNINNTTFSFDLLFATGPQVLWSIRAILGFTAFDYVGLPGYTGSIVITDFTGTDLGEEGVMYAEFEITENSTGLIVSSSEVSVFTVRGKVTDD